jgi:hypothetical protein
LCGSHWKLRWGGLVPKHMKRRRGIYIYYSKPGQDRCADWDAKRIELAVCWLAHYKSVQRKKKKKEEKWIDFDKKMGERGRWKKTKKKVRKWLDTPSHRNEYLMFHTHGRKTHTACSNKMAKWLSHV